MIPFKREIYPIRGMDSFQLRTSFVFSLSNYKSIEDISLAMKPKQIQDTDQIAFLKGDVNYTIVYFENGNCIMEPCTLKRYEEKLKSFLRISRSHLVNPTYVEKIVNEGPSYSLRLKNGKSVQVSRRKRSLVEEIKPLVLSH